MAAGENQLYLSLYTPWELLGSRLDGDPVRLDAAEELGRRVYSTGLVVPSKGSVTLVFELSGRLDAGVDDYRLDLHRQPDSGSGRHDLNPRGRQWLAGAG